MVYDSERLIEFDDFLKFKQLCVAVVKNILENLAFEQQESFRVPFLYAYAA